MMRAAAFVLMAWMATIGPVAAGDGPEFWTCNELWTERNRIYKEAGYCFRTPRAIRVFGNAGCQHDDVNAVPLSANQRRDIADIQRYETIRNCPR